MELEVVSLCPVCGSDSFNPDYSLKINYQNNKYLSESIVTKNQIQYNDWSRVQ